MGIVLDNLIRFVLIIVSRDNMAAIYPENWKACHVHNNE